MASPLLSKIMLLQQSYFLDFYAKKAYIPPFRERRRNLIMHYTILAVITRLETLCKDNTPLIAASVIILSFLYFLPTLIAISLNRPFLRALFLWNFIMGWHIVGWLSSMAGAILIKMPHPQPKAHSQSPLLPENYPS